MSRGDLNENEKSTLDLNSEVKNLNRQKSNLIIETNKLDEGLSKRREELIGLDKQIAEIRDNAQAESDRIKEEATILYDKVKDKEKEANKNLGQANEKLKEAEAIKKQAEDLIKSNQGFQKNLIVEKEEVAKIKIKLISVVELINKTLE